MYNLLKLEWYRIWKSKKILIIIFVTSIFWNNWFVINSDMFRLSGKEYWNAFSTYNLFLPFILIVITSFYMNQSIEANIYDMERIAGYNETFAIISKILIFPLVITVVFNGLFVIEFAVLSFKNGIEADVFELLIRNISYCIGIFTIVTISIFIMHMVRHAYKGAFYSMLIYILIGIMVGCIYTVIEVLTGASLHFLRGLLLFYEFGIIFDSSETGESYIRVLELSILSFWVHFLLLYICMFLSEKYHLRKQ